MFEKSIELMQGLIKTWLIKKLGETVMYEDESLICEDCGKEFVFTVGEQEFYAEKGLTNKPKRCPDCRKLKKQKFRGQRKMYDVVCAKCGVTTQVPFNPTQGKDVLCKACFDAQKAMENSEADAE